MCLTFLKQGANLENDMQLQNLSLIYFSNFFLTRRSGLFSRHTYYIYVNELRDTVIFSDR